MPTEEALPPDEPLAQRVRTGLAKAGIALKQQAWAEAGGRGLTPPRDRCWRCSGQALMACVWVSWPSSWA